MENLEKTVVHCPEKWMFEEVLKWHESKSHKWYGGSKPLAYVYYFDIYKNESCLRIGDCIKYSPRKTYQEFGYTILSFEQFKQQFMNEKGIIKLSIEKAKEWYKQGGDLREVALQAYDESELKKEILTWEDFIADNPSKELYAISELPKEVDKRKSLHAFCKLSYLIPLYNGDWVADWVNSKQLKYSIERFSNRLFIDSTYSYYSFLAFKDESTAEKFLKYNEDLIKDYYMID